MKTWLKRIWYWGRKHRCNVCFAHIRTWIEVGLASQVFNNHEMVGAGRRKRGCPVCHSTDRDRLMLLFFETQKAYLLNQVQPSILHFAPEPYLSSLLKNDSSHYQKGDMFTVGYNYPSDTLKMDIQQIPFPDNSWDMVIANHVLEHVENDALAMSEVWRALKPNGIAIMQVPIATDLKSTIEAPSGTDELSYEKITGQFDHRRLYGMDYFDRLKQAGFELEFWSKDNLNSYLGLNPLERIVVARKKFHS